MNYPIRVAQIIGRTLNGGVENLIYNYYLNVDKTKIQFDFFVEKESEIINIKKIREIGGNVIIIPSYKKIFKYCYTLKNIFLKEKYDIVQSNMNSLSFFSLYAAKKASIKVRICNSLSTTNKKEKFKYLLKMIFKPFSKNFATKYFACSNSCGEWLYGKKIIKNKNYYKINNAIDIEKYQYNDIYRNELIIKHNLDGKFIIGTIGRLEPQKNQMFLLDVFKEIKNVKENSFLIIIGDGYLYESLKNKAEQLNIEKDVMILTSKDVGVRGAALKYYSLFDVFVLPSLYEGLPTVGIEAQINNLPCFFSSNITKETQINDNCVFIPLKYGPKYWCNEIIDYKFEFRKKSFYNEDFDVIEQGKKLTLLYEKFMEEVGK